MKCRRLGVGQCDKNGGGGPVVGRVSQCLCLSAMGMEDVALAAPPPPRRRPRRLRPTPPPRLLVPKLQLQQALGGVDEHAPQLQIHHGDQLPGKRQQESAAPRPPNVQQVVRACAWHGAWPGEHRAPAATARPCSRRCACPGDGWSDAAAQAQERQAAAPVPCKRPRCRASARAAEA